jgi:hypothetical protein
MSRTSADLSIDPEIAALPQDEVLDYSDYDVAAVARGHEVIFMDRAGSYQGDYVFVSRNKTHYFVWSGGYGSCSGCDGYEASGLHSGMTRKQVAKFASEDKPFIEIPVATMLELCRNETLSQVFPANTKRDTYGSEIDIKQLVTDVTVRVRCENEMEISLADIFRVRNQEIKTVALRAFGYEKFIIESKAVTVDRDGENSLLRAISPLRQVADRDPGEHEVWFVFVKDSTGDKRYLLRVPPRMGSVKEAIAWTFGMQAGQYAPVKET